VHLFELNHLKAEPFVLYWRCNRDKQKKALKGRDGVGDAKVYFNTGRIEVQHDPERVSTEDLIKAIQEVGYEAKVAAF
jgi:copper chaperone